MKFLLVTQGQLYNKSLYFPPHCLHLSLLQTTQQNNYIGFITHSAMSAEVKAERS